MQETIKQLRRELHQHPELSGQETETAIRIQKFIENHHPTKIITGIGGDGLAAIYEFSNDGPTVMIRCELDALPIDEVNTFQHRSKRPHVSHKCGHDGHMAIVAGLIFWLKEQAFKNGKIVLLFQPAEETGEGASAVMRDPKFKMLDPDYVFALHNLPGEPLNTIITVKRGFSATVQSMAIYLTGVQSHASEPEKGINPALAIAEITHRFSSLNITDVRQDNFTLITPVYLNMGSRAYGISAGSGELHFTLRTWTEVAMQNLQGDLKDIVTTVCKHQGLQFATEWFDYFPATVNNELCNEIILQACKANGFSLIEKGHPFKFGEDFGWFSQHYNGAYFGLGSGVNSPALHHVDYDFPDEIIETGIKMFSRIIEQVFTLPAMAKEN